MVALEGLSLPRPSDPQYTFLWVFKVSYKSRCLIQVLSFLPVSLVFCAQSQQKLKTVSDGYFYTLLCEAKFYPRFTGVF